MEETPSSLRQHVLLAFVVALAVALRLWDIADQSFWFDEGWSVHIAHQTVPRALELLASEGHTHPPGYYMLLWGWIRLLGDGEVAVRSLSAFLGILSIWFTYRFAQRLTDTRTGLVAALVLAINPAHIVYSQEARMYAMLCASLAALWALHARLECTRPEPRDWRFWMSLALAETCAIYAHYFAALAIAAMALWVLPSLVTDRSSTRWPRVWAYIGCHVLALLAYSPWIKTALADAVTHTTLDTTNLTLPAFVWETWTFLLGGHIAMAGREPLFAALAALSAACSTVLVLWLLVRRQRFFSAGSLALQGAGISAMVWGVFYLRSGYHPRYLLMILPLLATLVAQGIMALYTQPKRGLTGKALAVGLALVLASAQGVAFVQLKNDDYYDRDDARSVADLLIERLPPGSPVLLDVQDWALDYYLSSSRLSVHMVDGSASVDDVIAAQGEIVSGHAQAALVGWHQGTTDMRDILDYALERRGHLLHDVPLSGYLVSIYGLTQRDPPVVQSDGAVHWGAIQLLTATCDSDVPANGALAIAMQWQIESDLPEELRVALHVFDPGGHQVAHRNIVLRDTRGSHSQSWEPGRRVWSFGRIPLPDGLAPLEHEIRITLYCDDLPEGLDVLDKAGSPAGKAASLLTTHLASPLPELYQDDSIALADAEPLDILASPGLLLAGYHIGESTISSGESLTVELWWRAETELPDHIMGLELGRGEDVLASTTYRPVYGLYPTDHWLPCQTVHEFRELQVPTGSASGDATLRVRIDQGPPIVLSTVSISKVDRSFAQPQPQHRVEAVFGSFGQLVGYDVDRHVAAASPVSLTLYWQGLASSKTPYVVFTHLLDGDGRLIAQHDGEPSLGQRPTSGWVQGEYITDGHVLDWLVADYAGEAVLEVGLYDASTGERVPMSMGSTYLLLPVDVTVESRPPDQ